MEQHYINTKLLLESVKDKIGKPVNNEVVAATIESLGVREKDTINDFGYSTLRELADALYIKLTKDENNTGLKNIRESEISYAQIGKVQVSDYLWIKTKIFAEYYTLGLFNLLPVLIQLIAVIFFGFSLWTFSGFNIIQSTSVVLGVILGLILSGGLVQVIGKQASFFWNYKDYEMIKKTITYLNFIGIKSILFVLSILLISNFIIPTYPNTFLLILFTYAFLIGMLLIFLAPLHTIKQRWVITFSIFCGTLIAIILKEFFTIDIFFIHWLAIIVSIIVSKFLLKFYVERLNRTDKILRTNEINNSVLLYNNYQYFLYGTFIYIFLFIDRILAWSSGNGHPLPFLIYFEKNYELGMDLAMLSFLLLSGVLEYSIASFTKFIDMGQKSSTFKMPHAFNNRLRNMYCQQILLLFISSAFAALVIYYIINSSRNLNDQLDENLVQLSIKVCWLGGLGYIFLAWGMLNSLYLFTLGQSLQPLKAIIYSCLFNVFIGFVLSRFIAYEYSVLGMLFGATIFAALTLKSNLRFFNNLDYYYYAAF